MREEWMNGQTWKSIKCKRKLLYILSYSTPHLTSPTDCEYTFPTTHPCIRKSKIMLCQLAMPCYELNSHTHSKVLGEKTQRDHSGGLVNSNIKFLLKYVHNKFPSHTYVYKIVRKGHKFITYKLPQPPLKLSFMQFFLIKL